jgi:hypothetical protein
LCARDAGDELHGEEGYAAFGQLAHSLWITERIGGCNEHEPFAHELEVGGPGMRVGPQTAHLEDEVGRFEQLAAVVGDFRADGCVRFVGESCGEAGPRLDAYP